ncbi:ankyrin, partial [Morchella conica CCBAS932]
LHWASEGGHKAVVDVLLSHSADINVKDRWGMTAIYYASEAGHRAVVEVLLSHGADIGAKDKWEKTALHCA